MFIVKKQNKQNFWFLNVHLMVVKSYKPIEALFRNQFGVI